MRINRIIIGIKFNRKMFRLSSMSGIVIDEILSITSSEKKALFTHVNVAAQMPSVEGTFTLINERNSNSLTLESDNFVYKKSAQNETSSVNFDTAFSEFDLIWKSADKILSFPEIRRIGIVAEYQIKPHSGNASVSFFENLTKMSAPKHCSRLIFTFDDKKLMSNEHRDINIETDDFETTIKTLYLSELDETPVKGLLNANIDYQRYYNPAKKDGLRELRNIKSKFIEEKERFKQLIEQLGT